MRLGELRMNTRQLEYFVAVAEERSFTRAAKRFFVSQAALSMQVKALERDLGCKLFDRNNRNVALTPAGSSLLDDARAILARSEEAVRRARAAGSGPAGELRVGYLMGYERTDLVDMVSDFHEAYPSVRLTFLRENTTRLYDALRQEQIDVSINLLWEEDAMGEIEWQDMRRFPLVAVVPAKHPLAQRSSIALTELSSYPIIEIDWGQGAYGESETIVTAYREEGFNPQVSFVSRDVETTVLCVAAGLGFALMPSFIAETAVASAKVVSVPLRGFEERIRVVAAWMPKRKNELIDVFLDEFLQVET